MTYIFTIQVTSLVKHSHRRRRETRDIGLKKHNSAISLNMNTIASKYNTLDRASPNMNLLVQNGEDASTI
jgi:hypothetical protein